MSMIKAIKSDLVKSLLGFPSLAAVIITFVLCLTGSVYTNAEGRAYSVSEALLNFERGFGDILGLYSCYGTSYR